MSVQYRALRFGPPPGSLAAIAHASINRLICEEGKPDAKEKPTLKEAVLRKAALRDVKRIMCVVSRSSYFLVFLIVSSS